MRLDAYGQAYCQACCRLIGACDCPTPLTSEPWAPARTTRMALQARGGDRVLSAEEAEALVCEMEMRRWWADQRCECSALRSARSAPPHPSSSLEVVGRALRVADPGEEMTT